jgi:hypothetical protein
MRAIAILPSLIATPVAADEAVGLACAPVDGELPTKFVAALIDAMRASYVSLFVHDGELHTAFAEPGVAGRPERDDFLDSVDGAQRALYRLMCAIPGAIEAVRETIAAEGRA